MAMETEASEDPSPGMAHASPRVRGMALRWSRRECLEPAPSGQQYHVAIAVQVSDTRTQKRNGSVGGATVVKS